MKTPQHENESRNDVAAMATSWLENICNAASPSLAGLQLSALMASVK